jgi:hypothetical protein
MNTYLVTWRIDIEADNPEEAAAQALIAQRDPDSTAVWFEVLDKTSGIAIDVDLDHWSSAWLRNN